MKNRKDNLSMYKTITALHDNGTALEYNTINRIFDLEKRTKLDLQNLREYIVCVTLMCGQDVLKAQVNNDKEKEKVEILKHEKRCELMTILLQAIESVICTLD